MMTVPGVGVLAALHFTSAIDDSAGKRRAVGYLMTELGLSERRGCRIVGLSRYLPTPKNDDTVVVRLEELASETAATGYLRLHAVLRREGLVVNRKRTYRLYTDLGLQVRTRKRRKLPHRDRVAPQVPERPMQRWSLDSSATSSSITGASGRSTSSMTSRFCPGQIVDISISDARMARFLDGAAPRAAGGDRP
jgi:putative transposase